MPKDIYDIQEQTFEVLVEVLGLVKQQETKLKQLEGKIQALESQVDPCNSKVNPPLSSP